MNEVKKQFVELNAGVSGVGSSMRGMDELRTEGSGTLERGMAASASRLHLGQFGVFLALKLSPPAGEGSDHALCPR